MSNETLLYICGITLAVSAVGISFIGLKVKTFPGKAMPLVVIWFAIFVGGSATFAVLHAKDEDADKAKEAAYHEAGEKAEKEGGHVAPLESGEEEGEAEGEGHSEEGAEEEGAEEAPESAEEGAEEAEQTEGGKSEQAEGGKSEAGAGAKEGGGRSNEGGGERAGGEESGGTEAATDPASLTVTAVNDAPIITSNGGGATANVNVVEGNTTVTTVTATDVDLPADTLSYSLVGGIDQGFFSIHGGSGILTFNTAPFFASPADANMDNVYEIQVQVNDGNGGMDTQMINVTVTDTNTVPVINSNGGGTTASVNVDEATTAVTTVAATDVDLPGNTLTYSLVGGTDVSRFNINSSTGALTFKTNPDFENPVDADSDNVYHVQVQVSDGNGGTDTQTLNVSVTNIVEAPAPIPEPPPTSEPVPEPTTEPESDPVSEKATDSATSTSQPSLTGPQGTVTPAVISDSAHNQENTAERSGTTFGLGLALQHQLEGLSATHVAEWTSANTIGLNDTLSGPMRMFDIGRSTSVIPIGLEHQLNALAEHLQETIQQNQTQAQIVSGLATGTGVTLSAGYVAWILRGTSLLTSLFASLPAWGNFDPLPVLTGGYTARKAEEIGNQSAAAKENQEYQGIDEIFRDTHQD